MAVTLLSSSLFFEPFLLSLSFLRGPEDLSQSYKHAKIAKLLFLRFSTMGVYLLKNYNFGSDQAFEQERIELSCYDATLVFSNVNWSVNMLTSFQFLSSPFRSYRSKLQFRPKVLGTLDKYQLVSKVIIAFPGPPPPRNNARIVGLLWIYCVGGNMGGVDWNTIRRQKC